MHVYAHQPNFVNTGIISPTKFPKETANSALEARWQNLIVIKAGIGNSKIRTGFSASLTTNSYQD